MLPMIYMALVDDKDVPAFEKLYNRTYKRLYAIAYDILKDHQLAEDALSEMFLRVSLNFKKINNFTLHDLDAYLVRSIKNTCYNTIKKKKTEQKKLDELKKEAIPDDDIFEKAELVILMKAIRSLPENYKTALVYKEYYGFSVEETAKRMNVSRRSVFYYFNSAKNLIRKAIEGSDQDEQ